MPRSDLACALGAAVLGGCHLLTGVGNLRFRDLGGDGAEGGAAGGASTGGGGAGATSAGGGGGGGGTGGGGAGEGGGGAPPACTTPTECPGTDGACAQRTCENHVCGMELAAAGTACGDGKCDGSGSCSTGKPVWANAYGTQGQQHAHAIAARASGGQALVGDFTQSFDLGGKPLTRKGMQDLFVAKLSSSGGVSWAVSFGGSGSIEPAAVAITDAGAVIVAGHFDGSFAVGGDTLSTKGDKDAFVLMLDGSGKPAWARSYGNGTEQRATAVAAVAPGGVLVGGGFTGTVDFAGKTLTSQGLRDGFVLALDDDGSTSWARAFAGSEDDCVTAVAGLVDGDVAVAGWFEGAVDVGGPTALTGQGGHDVVVVRLGQDGKYVESAAFGDADDQEATGVAGCPDGDVVLTGWFDGQLDFGGGVLESNGHDVFVARLEADLGHAFSAGFGNYDVQDPHAVRCDGHGNMVIAGAMTSQIDFGGGPLIAQGGVDAFVAKLAANGTHLFSSRFGLQNDQQALGVATDTAGNVLLAGWLQASMTIGQLTLLSKGADDVWVAKLAP